jgi:hypothetical protein
MVSFTPRPLYSQGKDPGIHWIGGSVGPRAVLDAAVKKKIPIPRRESNPRTPIVQGEIVLIITLPFIIRQKLKFGNRVHCEVRNCY